MHNTAPRIIAGQRKQDNDAQACTGAGKGAEIPSSGTPLFQCCGRSLAPPNVSNALDGSLKESVKWAITNSYAEWEWQP